MNRTAITPPLSPPSPRIALAHDWLCGFRGGEAVLDRIVRLCAREFPQSPPPRLYIMTDDGRPLSPAIDALPKARSFLSRIPGGNTRLRRWLLPLYPRAVDALSAKLAADHAREPTPRSFDLAAFNGLPPPACRTCAYTPRSLHLVEAILRRSPRVGQVGARRSRTGTAPPRRTSRSSLPTPRTPRARSSAAMGARPSSFTPPCAPASSRPIHRCRARTSGSASAHSSPTSDSTSPSMPRPRPGLDSSSPAAARTSARSANTRSALRSNPAAASSLPAA